MTKKKKTVTCDKKKTVKKVLRQCENNEIGKRSKKKELELALEMSKELKKEIFFFVSIKSMTCARHSPKTLTNICKIYFYMVLRANVLMKCLNACVSNESNK